MTNRSLQTYSNSPATRFSLLNASLIVAAILAICVPAPLFAQVAVEVNETADPTMVDISVGGTTTAPHTIGAPAGAVDIVLVSLGNGPGTPGSPFSAAAPIVFGDFANFTGTFTINGVSHPFGSVFFGGSNGAALPAYTTFSVNGALGADQSLTIGDTIVVPSYSGTFAIPFANFAPGSHFGGLLVINTLPPAAPPGGGDILLATTDQGSPIVVIIPNGNGAPEQDPDPVTIIDVGAQLSAETTGQAVINSVNQGGRGTFRGFTNGISGHLNRLANFGGLGNAGFTAFQRTGANHTLNLQIAGAAGRWNGTSSLTASAISEPISVDTFVPKWELYTMGAFNRQDQDQIGLDPGFRSDSWSGTVGIERFLGSNLLIGFATTLGRNDIEAGGSSGGAEIDGMVLDAYALYAKNHFWTSLRYGYGEMDIDVTRNAFPGVTTRANTESEHSLVSWGAGMNLPFTAFGMDFVTGPNVGVDYITGSIDGYRERGGEGFNLIVEDQAYASLVSDVGWSIAKAHELVKLGRGYLQFRAGWEHEHLLDESHTDFRFETSPISVFDPATGETTGGEEVNGRTQHSTPQNDYAVIGLHLTQLLGQEERWVMRTGYQTQLFRSDFSEHYGYVRLGYQF